jgi:hypothetical protein
MSSDTEIVPGMRAQGEAVGRVYVEARLLGVSTAGLAEKTPGYNNKNTR